MGSLALVKINPAPLKNPGAATRPRGLRWRQFPPERRRRSLPLLLPSIPGPGYGATAALHVPPRPHRPIPGEATPLLSPLPPAPGTGPRTHPGPGAAGAGRTPSLRAPPPSNPIHPARFPISFLMCPSLLFAFLTAVTTRGKFWSGTSPAALGRESRRDAAAHHRGTATRGFAGTGRAVLAVALSILLSLPLTPSPFSLGGGEFGAGSASPKRLRPPQRRSIALLAPARFFFFCLFAAA